MTSHTVLEEDRRDIAAESRSLRESRRGKEKPQETDVVAGFGPAKAGDYIFFSLQKLSTTARRMIRPCKMLPGNLYVAPAAVLYDKVRTV